LENQPEEVGHVTDQMETTMGEAAGGIELPPLGYTRCPSSVLPRYQSSSEDRSDATDRRERELMKMSVQINALKKKVDELHAAETFTEQDQYHHMNYLEFVRIAF